MTLDLADIRAHVGPGPSDEDLEAALAAALEALDNKYGTDTATVTEYLRPFNQWVKLGRRASAVTSVKEGETALVVADDIEVWPNGKFLRRLNEDGRQIAWSGWAEVVYTPFSESAERDRIVYALCDLELSRTFGLRGITVGPWSEQYPDATDDLNYMDTREMILASLRPAMVGTW